MILVSLAAHRIDVRYLGLEICLGCLINMIFNWLEGPVNTLCVG